MKILFTGGGSGGHVFPIIAIARELRRLNQNQQLNLHYIGPNDALAMILLTQENITVHPIVTGKIRQYASWKNITDIAFNMPFGFLQSFFLVLFIQPHLVFGKGGSGSAPVLLAAHILGKPIFLHESDTIPGRSNRFAYPWAKKVFISFPKTSYFDLTKTILVGNPIKKELLEGSNTVAQELLNITFEKPIILVMGGSQGASAINDFILNTLEQLLQTYEVLHICGKNNYQEVSSQSEVILQNSNLQKYYHLKEFIDEVELKHAYSAASFIISRAGSGSIFEIAACGKPSILIPLPLSANNHQQENAYQYAQTGAAIIIEQDNLQPNFFLEKLNYLFSHPQELEAMKNAALEFSKPKAAATIAREILEYITK